MTARQDQSQSQSQSLESPIPEAIRERLDPPNRAKGEKITVRFTDEEFEILRQLGEERGEKTTAVVRKLALAALAALAGPCEGDD